MSMVAAVTSARTVTNVIHPFDALELRTPRLSLHPLRHSDVEALVAVVKAGLHDSTSQPFDDDWPSLDAGELAARFHAEVDVSRESSHAAWALPLVAVHDGQTIGIQKLKAPKWSEECHVSTFSFLGVSFHGKGFGTEMRHAAAHLSFEVLGAHYMRSPSWDDNMASLRVSEKVGYRVIGHKTTNGRRAVYLGLTYADWQSSAPPSIEVSEGHALADLLS